MNRPRSDIDARLMAWLEEGPTQLPDEVLSDTFARARSSRQDRAWLPAFPRSMRFDAMNMIKIAAFAVVLVAMTVVVLPRSPDIGTAPAPSPSPTPEASLLVEGVLPAGAYATTPFAAPGSDACLDQADCLDLSYDDTIRITFTVPEGWSGFGPDGILTTDDGSDSPGGMLLFVRGAALANDPCIRDITGEIPVGPGVDDFADAVASHPLLDVTAPVDVELGGYPGKYLELQVPDDPTIQGDSEPTSFDGCPVYKPWNPWLQAQGPGESWHLWVLDVEGVRVVVQAIDLEETSPDIKAQLQDIVDSIAIEPASPPAASPSSSPTP